jgi:hypothetical protein
MTTPNGKRDEAPEETEKDNAMIAAVLKKRGVTPKMVANVFLFECGIDYPDCLKILLALGLVDLNKVAPLSGGQTPLMHAATCGLDGVVRILLSHGADPNYQDPASGDTALHMACRIAAPGAMCVIKMLLKTDVIDTTLVNNDGKTAFEVAEKRRVGKMLKRILGEIQTEKKQLFIQLGLAIIPRLGRLSPMRIIAQDTFLFQFFSQFI